MRSLKAAGASIVLLILTGCASCGTASPPKPIASPLPPKPAAHASPVASPAPAEDAHFVVSKAGRPIGEEKWHTERAADGSLTSQYRSDLSIESIAIAAEGTLTFDRELRVVRGNGKSSQGTEASTETVSLAPAGDAAASTKGALVRTIERAGRPPERTLGTQTSRLYLLQSSMVGLLPICLKPPAVNDTFFAFPGAEVRVLSSTAQANDVREIVLDLASTRRMEIACQGSRVAAVSIPLESLSFVRDGASEIAKAMVARNERSKPNVPDELVEEDRIVQVPAKGSDVPATLSCSFLRPKADPAKTFPAVVFITGSGPEDRDEDSVGPGGLKLSIFKTIAIRLGKSGIASLRCDDRGTGKSTGEFAAATLDTFVRDARATVASLRKERSVDAKRIGVIGHSEGGVIGPRLALEEPTLRALFLMAAPGESLADIGIKQLKRELRKAGAPDDEIAKQVQQSNDVIDALSTGKPLPDSLDTNEKAVLEKKRAWLRSEFTNDPLRVASKLKCPVFIAQGGRDEQVPPEDAEALLAAIRKGGNTKAEAKTYPALSHVFAPTITGSMADYSDPNSKMSEEFLGDAVRFLTTTLGR